MKIFKRKVTFEMEITFLKAFGFLKLETLVVKSKTVRFLENKIFKGVELIIR